MIRSTSGSRPVISQSSHTRFWADLASVALATGVLVESIVRIVADDINSLAMAHPFPSLSLSLVLTFAFAATLLAGLVLNFWLSSRQIRHVAQHRGQVPPASPRPSCFPRTRKRPTTPSPRHVLVCWS